VTIVAKITIISANTGDISDLFLATMYGPRRYHRYVALLILSDISDPLKPVLSSLMSVQHDERYVCAN
jgi:hypothetical protein